MWVSEEEMLQIRAQSAAEAIESYAKTLVRKGIKYVEPKDLLIFADVLVKTAAEMGD